VGHLFGAFQVAAFADPAEFGRQVDDWIRTLRATRPAAGTSGPMIPGDPNRRAEQVRRREGIPVIGPVVEALERVARQTGVPLG
jgi:LDH2 family malate/lactate/ureidoglycolate dehydrogenase